MMHMKARLFVLLAVALLCAGACYDDTEVRERLDKLEKTSIPGLDTQISNLKNSISSMEAVDAQIKSYISDLQKKDEELSKSIESLDSDLSALDGTVAAIKEELASVKAEIERMQKVEASLTDQLNSLRTDLKVYVDGEFSSIKQWAEQTFVMAEKLEAVVEDVSAVKAGLKDLSEEMEQKIDDSVAAVKTWVEGLLEDYCKSEELSKAMTEVNGKLQTLYDMLTSLESRLDTLSDSVKDILARIQSVTFVPRYSDGAVTAWYAYKDGVITAGSDTLDFKLRPAGIAAKLAAAPEALGVDAVYTMTRAGIEPFSLGIKSVSAGGDILCVVVDGGLCPPISMPEPSRRVRRSTSPTATMTGLPTMCALSRRRRATSFQ